MLSFYFIASLWIFFERFFLLKRRIGVESESLHSLYTFKNDKPSQFSLLYSYLTKAKRPTKSIFDAAISDAVRVSTKGLTWLSIFASTAPFVGLFGTVVGILETFATLSGETSASLNVVAPAISEALVATAAGIFVAIFAYAFHLVLKRKAYELSSLLTSQAEVILSLTEK